MDTRLTLRLTAAERAALQERAAHAGLTLTEYARAQLLRGIGVPAEEARQSARRPRGLASTAMQGAPRDERGRILPRSG